MIFFINSFVIALVVLIHYEFLYRITTAISKIKHHFRIITGVIIALNANTIEI